MLEKVSLGVAAARLEQIAKELAVRGIVVKNEGEKIQVDEATFLIKGNSYCCYA